MSRSKRFRSKLFLRVIIDRVEHLFPLERVDKHSAMIATSPDWIDYFCLEEESCAEDMPEPFRSYGGGRVDCCDPSLVLAPEALALCRALRDLVRERVNTWKRSMYVCVEVRLAP